ncbi:MAG: hypothetical protein NG747_12920 [Candidatus Brocadia sp.]|nr:hypothetical protein [Candidatus Brocadia sp.]
MEEYEPLDPMTIGLLRETAVTAREDGFPMLSMSFGFRSLSNIPDGCLLVMFEFVATERTSCIIFHPRRIQSGIVIYRFAMLSFFYKEIYRLKK